MNSDQFFLGSNPNGESGPTYLAAEACGITTPMTTGAIGFPAFQALLIANGTDDNGAVRLSQSADEVNVVPGSVHCGAGGIHAGNSYYREFTVSAAGDLNLTSLEMGIEASVENLDGLGTDPNPDGMVPVQVALYYDTPIGSIAHSGITGPSGFDETFCGLVPGDNSADLTIVTLPIAATVPAGTTTVVIEIFTPGSDTDPATDFCFNNSSMGCDFPLGDLNMDMNVDLLDVTPFVTGLTGGMFICEGDINEDGAFDLLDVTPFVDILTGG